MENQTQNHTSGSGALSVKDVARELGVSKATVLRWVRAGKIEGFFRIGHKWLIRRSDLDSLIKNRMAQPLDNGASAAPETKL
jgi:excisionase family DNA binding protein